MNSDLFAIITSSISTASIIVSAIVCILQSFYFTRKEANKLKEEVYDKILLSERAFENRLEKYKAEVKEDLTSDHDDVKKELEKLSNKIDDMTNQFITFPTYKAYTESINKMFELVTDRTARMEDAIDSMREELSDILKLLKK